MTKVISVIVLSAECPTAAAGSSGRVATAEDEAAAGSSGGVASAEDEASAGPCRARLLGF